MICATRVQEVFNQLTCTPVLCLTLCGLVLPIRTAMFNNKVSGSCRDSACVHFDCPNKEGSDVSVYGIHRLLVPAEAQCVLCDVRTVSLSIMQIPLSRQRVNILCVLSVRVLK